MAIPPGFFSLRVRSSIGTRLLSDQAGIILRGTLEDISFSSF